MRLIIGKMTAEGENVQAEFELPNETSKEAIEAALRPVYDAFDQRLLEINMRIIAANKKARALPAEAKMAYNEVIDILHGRRQQAPDTVDVTDTDAVQGAIERLNKDNVVQFGERK